MAIPSDYRIKDTSLEHLYDSEILWSPWIQLKGFENFEAVSAKFCMKVTVTDNTFCNIIHKQKYNNSNINEFSNGRSWLCFSVVFFFLQYSYTGFDRTQSTTSIVNLSPVSNGLFNESEPCAYRIRRANAVYEAIGEFRVGGGQWKTH